VVHCKREITSQGDSFQWDREQLSELTVAMSEMRVTMAQNVGGMQEGDDLDKGKDVFACVL